MPPRHYFDPWGDVRGWPSSPARRIRPVAPVPPPRPEPLPREPVDEAPAPPEADERAAEPAVEAPGRADAARVREALEELGATRRRLERDAERAREQARGEVIEEMLPVLDNLDRSIAAAEGTPDQALLRGIELVRSQFEEKLGRVGLQRIDCVGRRFDPGQHDAIAIVPVDDPARDGTVIDEVSRGYRMGDRIVRAPKVSVGRARVA